MKYIIAIFIVGLLPFLYGCDNTNQAVYVYLTEIEFKYVDNEGNTLYFENDGTISLIPYDELYAKIKTLDDNSYLKKSPIEILSITDENDNSLVYRPYYKTHCMFRFFFQEPSPRKREYNYIIKYKVPLFYGETVEEIRITRRLNEIGNQAEWLNCAYNDESIRIYTFEELFPDCHDPQHVPDSVEYSHIEKAMLYNGDLVAVEEFSIITISLPIDFTKVQE